MLLLVLCASGLQHANSQCIAGSTGPIDGVCSPCESGTYMYREADDIFAHFLQTNTPYIVSDAADWNTSTNKFDGMCGNTTCSGNTGALELGTATTGSQLNNGARRPVSFVGGNTGTRLQWGAGSIPSVFTICSVTRYSGSAKGRILNAHGNAAGSLNWLHGHYAGNAGVNHYNAWNHGSDNFPLAANTDWVVMCASNLNKISSIGVMVNGIIKSNARGGQGNCALGINHNEASDWQFSKVYVWNTHLSDEELTLASLSLYSALFTVTTASGVCLPCQANSQSQPGASVCGCNAGYTAQNGWLCRACAANTFKAGVGFDVCTLCPANSASPAGSVTGTSCRCNVGFFGLDGGVCGICPANSRSLIPDVNITSCQCNANFFGNNGDVCTGCPANSQSVFGSLVIAGCKCNEGYYGVNGVCSLCPAKSMSVVGSNNVTDCVCLPGYIGQGGGPCNIPVCPVGMYSSAPSRSVCDPRGLQGNSRHACNSHSECNYPNCHNFNCWIGRWQGSPYNGWNHRCGSGGANRNNFCHGPIACVDGCYQCPANSNSIAGSNAVLDCKCNAGWTGWTDKHGFACRQCVAGKYKDATGSIACSDCPVNSMSVIGSGTADACLCNVGFSGGNGETCTECAAGTYKSITGNASCTRCTSNRTLVHVATSIDMCVQCQPNALPTPGMYNNYNAGFQNCSCIPGHSNADSGEVCLACVAGKAKAEIGSAPCWGCPENAGVIGINNRICLCNVGYYGSGTTACTACGVGLFKNTMGIAECTTCPFERSSGVASTSVSNCSGCVAGKHISRMIIQVQILEYISECSTADIRGLFHDIDTMWETYPMYKHVTQELFMYYKTPNTENANWGYVLGQHPTLGVLPHAYSGTANLSTGAIEWFQQCLFGPEVGKWWPLSAMTAQLMGSACLACSIGKFSNTSDASVCTSCDASSYTDTPGMTECKKCPTPLCQCSAGFTGEFGWLCEACPVNTFKSSVGSAACSLCPANAASPAASTVDTNCSCNADYFGENGKQCTACPANSFSAPGSTTIGDCSCNAGYLNLESDIICSYCSAGSFFAQNSKNTTVCRCLPGFFGPDGGECTALARPGSFVTRYTYNPGNEMRRFSSVYVNHNFAPLGAWSSWRPSSNPSWMQIDTGVVTSILGVITEGRDTWGGYWVDLYRVSYSELDSGPFIEYPMHFHGGQARRTNLLLPYVRARYIRIHPLKWTTDTPNLRAGLFIEGSSVCNLGEISTGNITSADECSRCPSGTYNDVRGAEICTPCAVDTFSGPKALVCIGCVANSNSNSSTQRTICLCNPGWTQGQTAPGANKECEQCAVGKFKDTTGDAACSHCAAGKFKNTTGKGVCSNCENVKTIDNVLTCVNVVSFRLFLTELSADQHVLLQGSIARQFGLSPSMVEIRIVPAGSRRLLSQPFAVDIIVSVPNNDASGASTPPTPSMRNIYQGLAEDQFVLATMLIDGGTHDVHLAPGFAQNMPLRTVLNTNIGGNWSAGDKVIVYANGQPGINNVVLTYVGETGDSAVGRWSPVNCEPLLESNSTYLFFLKGGQINLYMSK